MYIEKDKTGDFFNPVSTNATVKEISSKSSTNKVSLEDGSKDDRWSWLVDHWKDMSYKERMSLFLPYIHYVNPRDYFKSEFDKKFQEELVETAYKLCRPFVEFKFDPDGKGVPNILMIFGPIDYTQIPNAEIESLVKQWGIYNGFINSECHCCCDC